MYLKEQLGGRKSPFPLMSPAACMNSAADLSPREQDKDEDQLNHRIPHRFGPITNISPNWCCHCGLVLPLGRKHARKCSGESDFAERIQTGASPTC